MSASKLKELVDLYSEPINFTYKKRSEFKTTIGGCLSLAILLSLLTYLSYLLYKMVLRDLPSIIKIEGISQTPPALKIKKDNSFTNLNSNREAIPLDQTSDTAYWPVSFGIRNTGKSVLIEIDASYMSFQVEQAKWTEGGIIYTPLHYQLCPKFGLFPRAQFDFLSLNATYCINDDFEIAQLQGMANSSWVEARVAMCQGSNCKSTGEIINWMKTIQLEVYYQQRVVNTTALGEGVATSSIVQYYWDVMPSFTKAAQLELGMDVIHSYEGYLPAFLQSNFEKNFVLRMKQFNVHLLDLDDRTNVLIVSISPSRASTLYERRYVDVFYQLSMVGGISSVVFLIGFLFVSSCAKFRIRESLMNDFYNVIPSDNTKKVEVPFEEFIEKRYNDLIGKYEQRNKELLKETKGAVNFKPVVEMRHLEKRETVVNINENDSLIEEDDKKVTQEAFVDEMFKVTDDEGLFTNSSEEINAVQRYFTLRRIESIFNVSKAERDTFLLESEKENADKKSYKKSYEKFFANKAKGYLFKVEKAVYDAFIYTCNDKMYFNPWEVMLKICCCCLFRKKKTEKKPKSERQVERDQQESNLSINFRIFDASVQKLGLDFDLVSVLKSVENFEHFKLVYFDEAQRGLFDSVSNPVIKVEDLNEMEEEELDEVANDQKNLNDFRHALMRIVSSGSLKVMEKNMLQNMGISLDDIKKFSQTLQEDKDVNLNTNVITNASLNADFDKENKLTYENKLSSEEVEDKAKAPIVDQGPIVFNEEEVVDTERARLPDETNEEFFKKINEKFNK